MKKAHVIGLLLLSVALSHALAPAIAWAQAKAQNAFYSLTVTDTVTASGDVTADQYVASGSASQYSCSKTDGTCQFSSATADGTTSSTVGSFTFKAGANITAADLLLDVQDSAGAHALTVTEAGSAVALLNFTSPAIIANSGNVSVTTGAVVSTNGTGAQSGLFSSATSNINLYTNNGGAGNGVTLGAGTFTPYLAGTVSMGTAAAPWSDFAGDASVRGTCTLDGASPSKCTATVTASALCVCSGVGTTAAAAVGCATSVTSTTLTITAANGLTSDVRYICFL